MTNVYTATLNSGYMLTVTTQMSFGEAIISGVLLMAVVIAGFETLFRMVYP